MKKQIILFLGCFLLGISQGSAQKLAIKTNLLYDATTTLNLAAEIGLSHHFTLDVGGNYNPWEFSENIKLKHWFIQPEIRYWSCEKFRRHFFGLHVHGGEFNAGGIKLPFGIGDGAFSDYRYTGNLYGAGVSYGYHWILGDRWGLEANIGAGYARIHYKKYNLAPCTPRLSVEDKNYWGITRAGLTLVFMIK